MNAPDFITMYKDYREEEILASLKHAMCLCICLALRISILVLEKTCHSFMTMEGKNTSAEVQGESSIHTNVGTVNI